MQYAANEYVAMLKEIGAKISMAAVGEAWQNGYAERLMRTIKEEEVDLSEYRNFAEAYEQIGTFLEEVYSKKGIHSSLGYLTPSEYEAEWSEKQKREYDIKEKSPWNSDFAVRSKGFTSPVHPADDSADEAL